MSPFLCMRRKGSYKRFNGRMLRSIHSGKGKNKDRVGIEMIDVEV